MTKTRFRLKPVDKVMGKIVVDVVVSNLSESGQIATFEALVDTGATFLTLPSAWKADLGDVEVLEDVELELASGEVVEGEICGPVKIKIGDFRQIAGEVLFIDMDAGSDGKYEPLIGYLPLEAIPVGIDMLNHRLFRVKAMLK
ncbi:MAG: retropepsin-like aspartic protease [Pyrinomonadaceae bacterium]